MRKHKHMIDEFGRMLYLSDDFYGGVSYKPIEIRYLDEGGAPKQHKLWCPKSKRVAGKLRAKR